MRTRFAIGLVTVSAVMSVGLVLADDSPVVEVENTIRLAVAPAPQPKSLSPPPKSLSPPPKASSPRGWRKSLDQIPLDVRPSQGRLPTDQSGNLMSPADPATASRPGTRDESDLMFYWVASEAAHQPLYFDDQPLERYGQTVSRIAQPVLSGVRFFGTLPIIPYKIGHERTHDCVSTLGYHRVGTCAPPTRERLPVRLDASLFEAGTWVGFIFLLP